MKKIDLNDRQLSHSLMKALFAVYFALLVWAILFKFGMTDYLLRFYVNTASKLSATHLFFRSIIPFAKIYIGDEIIIRHSVSITDALNVLVFIPFGFFVFYLTGENTKKAFKYALCATVFFEVIQYFTLIGAFATKDIITNFLGALIGVLIFKACKKISFSRAYNVCAIVLLFCGAIMLAVAVYTVAANFDGYLFILLRK